MKQLQDLVKRNIQLAEFRQLEASPIDVSTIRYWEGYITALESLVAVLSNEQEDYEHVNDLLTKQENYEEVEQNFDSSNNNSTS